MAKKEKETLSALDRIKLDMKNQYGEEAIVDFDNDSAMKVERLVTDSPNLNSLLGGGVPRGRILEIYGPESAGKTTVISYILGQFQAQGELVAFIDAEHALDPEYARTLGYNYDEGIFSQPDSGEQALNLTISLIETGEIRAIAVDSVAALTPQKELDGEIGDSNIGLQARMMSQAMRKMRGAAKRNNVTVLFVNQIRMKIGVMFGSPETTPGGNALKFYASIRMTIRKGDLLVKPGKEAEDGGYGTFMRLKTIKNKTAPPYRTTTMKVLFGKGIQTEEEWVEAAALAGFIQKGGAGWMTLENGVKKQGLDNLMEYFKENPQFKIDLIQKVKDYHAGTLPTFIEEPEDEVDDDIVVEAIEKGVLTDEDIDV